LVYFLATEIVIIFAEPKTPWTTIGQFLC